MSSIPNDESIDDNILLKYTVIAKMGSGAYNHVSQWHLAPVSFSPLLTSFTPNTVCSRLLPKSYFLLLTFTYCYDCNRLLPKLTFPHLFECNIIPNNHKIYLFGIKFILLKTKTEILSDLKHTLLALVSKIPKDACRNSNLNKIIFK